MPNSPSTVIERTGLVPVDYAVRPAASLKSLAIRGSVWTIAGHAASQILRLASNIVLTRLLVPQAFGLMALVNALLQSLKMLSDMGIRGSIIHHPNATDSGFLNTAWTVQVIRGGALWLLALLVAWPFAKAYGQPELIFIVPVAGLTLLIGGFASTSIFSLERRLNIGPTVLMDLGARLLSTTVMVGFALIYPSVWALVAGALVGSMTTAVVSRFLTPHRDRFAWDREARGFLFRFGALVSVSTAALFLANQGERLILGKLVTIEILGVYSVAHVLSTTGTVFVQAITDKVLFPSFAQLLRDRPKQAMLRYRQSRWLVMGLGAVSAAVLITLGPWLVRILFDPRYWAAGWMLQILGLEAFCEMAQAPAQRLLLASGRPGFGAWANGIRAAVLLAGLSIALSVWGLNGGIWVIALSSLVGALVFAYGVARVHPELRRQEIVFGATSCVIVAAGAVMLGFM